MIISINSKIVPEKQAKIAVTSQAFLFGQAVFETLRTYQQKPFRLQDHLKRLFESAKLMGLRPSWSLKKAEAAVQNALNKSREKASKIRVILTAEDLIVMVEKLEEKPRHFYSKGVSLISIVGGRENPRAKNLANAFTHGIKKRAVKQGAYEALMVNEKGVVRECAYANIFWVKKGVLFTNQRAILLGITRQMVLMLARQKKIKIRLVEITLKNLLKADEIFITQTTSGILPVVKIDKQKIGKGNPGETTRQLLDSFHQLIQGK